MEIQEGDSASDTTLQCHPPLQQSLQQGIWTSGHQSMNNLMDKTEELERGGYEWEVVM